LLWTDPHPFAGLIFFFAFIVLCFTYSHSLPNPSFDLKPTLLLLKEWIPTVLLLKAVVATTVAMPLTKPVTVLPVAQPSATIAVVKDT